MIKLEATDHNLTGEYIMVQYAFGTEFFGTVTQDTPTRVLVRTKAGTIRIVERAENVRFVKI